MSLKTKSRIWIALIVVIGLAVGIGIQLSLAASRDAEERRQAAVITGRIQVKSSRVYREQEQARLEKIEKARAAMPGRAEERARLWEDKHLELLMLVNTWNPLPEGYVPELEEVWNPYKQSVYKVDARCAEPLRQMMDDCAAAGNAPWICSAYRDQEYQQGLFDNKVERVLWEGVDWEDAPEVAAQTVAVPGTSEHQTGLAVDLIDEFYANLDENQERTDTQRWFMENCWQYGFILRYPNGTTDITGIIYEPWHYRYVGQAHAKAITELGITLEEYIELRRGR